MGKFANAKKIGLRDKETQKLIAVIHYRRLVLMKKLVKPCAIGSINKVVRQRTDF